MRQERHLPFRLSLFRLRGLPGGSGVDNPPANAGDSGSISGLERSPGEGNGNTLQYCAWEIPWTEEPGGLQFMQLQSQKPLNG